MAANEQWVINDTDQWVIVDTDQWIDEGFVEYVYEQTLYNLVAKEISYFLTAKNAESM